MFKSYGISERSTIIHMSLLCPLVAASQVNVRSRVVSCENESVENHSYEKGFYLSGPSFSHKTNSFSYEKFCKHEASFWKRGRGQLWSGVLFCFLAVSCWVNDAEDRKADELHRSLSQCGATRTVSLLDIYNTLTFNLGCWHALKRENKYIFTKYNVMNSKSARTLTNRLLTKDAQGVEPVASRLLFQSFKRQGCVRVQCPIGTTLIVVSVA